MRGGERVGELTGSSSENRQAQQLLRAPSRSSRIWQQPVATTGSEAASGAFAGPEVYHLPDGNTEPSLVDGGEPLSSARLVDPSEETSDESLALRTARKLRIDDGASVSAVREEVVEEFLLV